MNAILEAEGQENQEPNWEEIAKYPKPPDNKCAHAGCWSEGEMVGYAKCMIQKVKPLESKLFHANRLRVEDGMSAINECNELRSEIAELRAVMQNVKDYHNRPFSNDWALTLRRVETVLSRRVGASKIACDKPSYEMQSEALNKHSVMESLPNTELRSLFQQIKDHQMNYVELAITTEPYKLAEKGLRILDGNAP